ncbi:MAG: OB-fold nucleic acid binding domain-containing protein, partial [Patescibacteria group bacterium]
MKAHYPVQYMTAVLQAEAGDSDKVAAIVHECGRMGVEVLPPDVNESFRSFAMVSWGSDASLPPGKIGRIRFGLNAIKNVGEHICEVVYRERKDHGAFKNLENFLERIQDKDLNKKSLESLIQCGALDSFGYDRGVLLSNSEMLIGFMKQIREAGKTNQTSLFGAIVGGAQQKKIPLRDAPLASLDDKMKWEKTLLGLYVIAHPFAPFEDALSGVITHISELDGSERNHWVVLGGIVGSARKKLTKKGAQMLFAVIEDMTGSAELLVFPKVYETTRDVWREGTIVCVVGRTPEEEGELTVFVEKAFVLTKENVSDVARMLSVGKNNKKVMLELSPE